MKNYKNLIVYSDKAKVDNVIFENGSAWVIKSVSTEDVGTLKRKVTVEYVEPSDIYLNRKIIKLEKFVGTLTDEFDKKLEKTKTTPPVSARCFYKFNGNGYERIYINDITFFNPDNSDNCGYEFELDQESIGKTPGLKYLTDLGFKLITTINRRLIIFQKSEENYFVTNTETITFHKDTGLVDWTKNTYDKINKIDRTSISFDRTKLIHLLCALDEIDHL